MNFKRFNGSTWETVRHKIYGSGTDSLTAFPAMIQAAGEPLTDYTIYGNTLQNGTPTPEAPVDVVGFGERTGNLFYKTLSRMNIDANGRIISNSAFDLVVAKVTSGMTYSASGGVDIMAYYVDEPAIGSISYNNRRDSARLTITIPASVNYVVYRVTDRPNNVMLNLGSTALPYEPYGYKLPLTVNGTEHPIYLGQVETTRRIKKLVLTGGENWELVVFGGHNGFLTYAPRTQIGTTNCICSHYKTAYTNTNNTIYFISKPSNGRFIIFDDRFSSYADFKSWLAAQYAAGTPVTIWYVLETPETTVVNEPMHKIGDYADTISFAQAGVTIPTSDGDNTISFGTTVQPSAMSATFKGWHPVQGAKQYDGNDWR